MKRYLAITVVIAVGALAFALAEEPKPPAQKTAKAREVRKPWTTSKITGSPEPPPPYKAARVFPNVKFNHPLLIARCPGSERLFVGEQDGAIYSIVNKPDARAELFFDLKKEIKTLGKHPGARGTGDMYGLVFHPKFAENRFCYVCSTLTAKDPKVSHLPDGTRVSRFKVTDADPPRIDPASEEIVITFQGGGHNGGDLHFSPIDGMLYISTGDGRGPNPPDLLNTGQDCSDLLSSILRIDVDKRDPGKNHAVPKDNPFVGMKNVRPEIWAFGFRNPWRMSFDTKGQLWVGDVGWELWEMVHRVEKGGNYGWSIMEARQPVKPNQKPGPTPIRPPLIELPHTIAASITGGYVYRGKKFPELVGAYVFGDWETRRIWAARVDGDRVTSMPEIVKPSVRPSAFGEDNAGELYFLDYDNGMMFTLARNDAAAQNANFPKKLSETGLFKDVKNHVMAEGIIGYRPNMNQWMDSANAHWYLALPGQTKVDAFQKPRKLPGQVYWHEFNMRFPKDAVLVKTITPAYTGRNLEIRAETQILHFDGEDWHAYTYAWRDDPRVDNALNITTDGRKLATDARMLSATAPDFSESKVNRLVENVVDIWKKTTPKRSTQMIFADMGVNPTAWGYSPYDEIIQKLMTHGIPREQIAVIGDAESDAKKQALFEKVRNGSIRVLIGSTQKMGTGTNVQKRLVALHHLDAPWKPAEVEQRDGRILRQGNENEEAAIYRYVTEGSFDAVMWQALETKARFIGQVISGNNALRRAEDIGSQELSYAEVKAIASGNPAVLTLAEADAELQRLNLLKKNHLDEQYVARRSVRDLPERITNQRDRMTKLTADEATATAHAHDPITIGKQACPHERALNALGARLDSLPLSVREPTKILVGTFRGLRFGLILHSQFPADVYVEGATTRRVTLSRDHQGPRAVLNALDRISNGYAEDMARARQDLSIAESQLRDYQARLGKSFPHEAYLTELTDLRDKLKSILASTAQQDEDKGPNPSELAEKIKAIKAANSVEAAPQRPRQTHSTAEEPITARIRRKHENSDHAPVADALAATMQTSPAPMTFQERIERERQNNGDGQSPA